MANSQATDPALAAEDYCYVTTTGRVTGKPHRIEIWFALHGDTLYILAGGGRRSDWVKNALRQPRVDVRIADHRFDGTPRTVESTDEDALARRLLLEKYAKSDSDLDEWGRTALPVAIDLTTSAAES
jgi:deazaflavin-dependent oxidoreductase (nitroreductase family)